MITGGVRDSLQLKQLGLPTFSACIGIRGTGKNPAGDGATGEPVLIGDVVVRAGDLVFGDADGVVVLSPEAAVAAIPAAEDRDRAEAVFLERIRGGETTLGIYNL